MSGAQVAEDVDCPADDEIGEHRQSRRDGDADGGEDHGLHEAEHQAGHDADHHVVALLPIWLGIGCFARVVDDLIRNGDHQNHAEDDKHQQNRPNDAEKLAEDEFAAADGLRKKCERRAALDFVGHRDAGGPETDQNSQDHDGGEAGVLEHFHVFAERVVGNVDEGHERERAAEHDQDIKRLCDGFFGSGDRNGGDIWQQPIKGQIDQIDADRRTQPRSESDGLRAWGRRL